MSQPSDRWSPDLLQRFRQLGDPPADRLLAQLVARTGPEAARQVFDQLIRSVDLPLDQLPAEFTAFFEAQRRLPPWADPALMQQAEVVFLDHGPKFLLFLYYKSLPTLYAVADGARVLQWTGRLAHEATDLSIFTRRIAETGQFLLDVMAAGGLNANGRGLESILKVRLIHAAIRHFLPRDQWDEAAWGEPINQTHLAITLMTFSVSLLDGLRQTGLAVSAAEEAAYFHRWRVVGELMGIEEALLPASPEDGRALLAAILAEEAGPSEAGRLLTAALIQFGEEVLPGRLLDQSPQRFIRLLAGPELADLLGVDPPGCLGKLLPAVIRKLFRFTEALEEGSPGVARLTERVAQALTLRMVGFFDTYKQRPFAVPAALQQAWGLPESGKSTEKNE